MLTFFGPGPLAINGPSKVHAPTQERDSKMQVSRDHNYDTISISSDFSKESRFTMELVSRLSQEVRAATSISDIQALHKEVAEGRYIPDPIAVAARMLFLRET